ncbi:hypothetical protein LVJ94_05240 [Pendulispora rubella]|uniref:Uncharacterized protein n=1 Tax=Pendulispora rubella TaxID=2741070 RepID=A0ABZ2LBN9_9BACT
MAMPEVFGWTSSVILVLTVAKQVHKQWREGASDGVSVWLFIGQLSASSGFLIYSYLVRNWVFVVTNVLMLANTFAGLYILAHHRRREAARKTPGRAPQRGVMAAPFKGTSA